MSNGSGKMLRGRKLAEGSMTPKGGMCRRVGNQRFCLWSAFSQGVRLTRVGETACLSGLLCHRRGRPAPVLDSLTANRPPSRWSRLPRY